MERAGIEKNLSLMIDWDCEMKLYKDIGWKDRLRVLKIFQNPVLP